jgi:large subunit ribosomal protein L17
MRHRRRAKQLGRNINQRKALFRGLINSLIEHRSLITTQAKAKAIQAKVDKLVTRAKKDSVTNRRLVHSFLQKPINVKKLFQEIVPATAKRISGFTRITKLAPRRGDAALMVKLEWVDETHQPKSVEKPSAKRKVSKKKVTKPKIALPKPIKKQTLKSNIKARVVNLPRKILDS